MKIKQAIFGSVVGMLFLAASVHAQAEVVSKADSDAINALSAGIKKAIDAKDKKALEQFYSPDFIHVHAIGKFNDRAARIAGLVSGEPTIDSKGVEGFQLRKIGSAVIATGKIATVDDNGDPVVYAVTRVFAKSANKWQLVSSHASKVEE